MGRVWLNHCPEGISASVNVQEFTSLNDELQRS